MKKKSIYQSINFSAITIFVAIFALALGMLLKTGLSQSGIKPSNDLVAQAQQPNTQQKPTPTPSTIQQSQYLPESQSQNTHGIKFDVSNFFVENNHVFTDVCYNLPGKDVWDINAATLQYGQTSIRDFSVHETSINIANGNQQNGSRCLRLDFYIPEASPDLSSLTLTIGNIAEIAPLEGHECEGYMSRINSNAKVAQSGIKVVCEQSPSGSQVKITGKPQSISDNDANTLISKAMFNQINGPWVFTVTQNK